MDFVSFFESMKGRKIAFCGIGGSNLPLIDMFSSYGAVVSARDKRSREALGEIACRLEEKGVRLVTGPDYLNDLDEEIIFRTPAMKYHLPELDAARARGAVITSEMEVFFDLCPCRIYAVTGSDGKTTTTTLIAELLKAAGKTVHLGGNIGKPLLPEIASVLKTDAAVVELSSFQLISMRRSPEVAVVTNLSPNHLDVHKDMEEYISAKKNIFLHQNAFSRTVLNADNDITASFLPETRGDTYMFSRRQKLRGTWMDEKEDIYFCDEFIMHRSEIKLPGLHNVENYLAAISAVHGEVSTEIIRRVASEFSGVEHRAELVRSFEGVRYYNDSIASSPTRVIRGMLSLFDQKLILIAGGYDKKIPFDILGPAACEKVKLLILMGATADKIEAAVKAAPEYREGLPEILRVSSMEEAVYAARANAKSGDIVALSPACASFDLYKNFEARGNHFKKIVNELK